MSKLPPWKIRVGRKHEVIAEFSVPAHKLEKSDLDWFLRSVVARYRTDGPEDMVNYYVNRRRGNPQWTDWADVRQCWDFERKRIGYYCGYWECYAMAEREIDEAAANALRKVHEENKKYIGTKPRT